jgi:hypothetical protein
MAREEIVKRLANSGKNLRRSEITLKRSAATIEKSNQTIKRSDEIEEDRLRQIARRSNTSLSKGKRQQDRRPGSSSYPGEEFAFIASLARLRATLNRVEFRLRECPALK